MIGQTISHYKILEKLGEGGMGVVYKAEDTLLKRTVALKFLPPALTTDSEAKQRFIHEAQAASALDHPAICNIHEIATSDDGQMFIVMACYDGDSLKRKIEQGPLDLDVALNLAIQIAEGLSRAHEAGIIHRDIKPANIFVTDHNEVKILDFGLAKLSGQTMLTRTGSTLGTAAYMSPEQAKGEAVDQRTDIWSLGVVLYEMLTGRRPFESEFEQALIYEILNLDPKAVRSLRPEVPEAVEQIISKALAKAPDNRYQKAEDLLADLKAARTPELLGVTIAAAEALQRKRKKRRSRLLIATGVGVLVLAGVFFIGLPLIQDQALASNPRSVAFVSFENKTGDESLGYLHNVLPDGIGTTLEDSKYLRVIPSGRMRELMKQVGKDTVEFIDRGTGLQLCRRAGFDVLGVGQYTRAGPLFLTEMELIDVSTGARLGRVLKARGRGVESFLQPDGIVDELARQVSTGMGVSQLNTQASLTAISEVSTRSIEAQQYYLRGKLERRKNNYKDARSFLELAIKKDSTFALAWFELAACFVNLGDGPGLKYAKSHMLSNISRTTEVEKFRMADFDTALQSSLLASRGWVREKRDEATFFKARAEIFPFNVDFRVDYALSLRDSAAIAEYERILELDRANALAWNLLGYCYLSVRNGERALRAFERYAELQPGDPNPLHSMAEAYLALGKFDESRAKCEDVLRLKSDFYAAQETLAKLSFMRESYDDAISWIDQGFKVAPSRFYQAQELWWQAYYLVWAGRLAEAEHALGKSAAMLTAEYDFDRWLLERNIWLKGWIAYERGDQKEARAMLTAWAKTRSGHRKARVYPEFCLGLLDLQAGMMDSVGSRLERMRQIVFADTLYPAWSREDFWDYYGHALEGAYLLAMHRPGEIQAQRVWTHCLLQDDPTPQVTACWPIIQWDYSGITDFVWIPVPFDIVPRAYIERGMIDSAIASYEIALKKPPHSQGPIIPRYYYRLARLYEQKGMTQKAVENYTQFLKVWGKADPVYKEPADARRRLAKLKSTGIQG
jgi:eukaryotic-like serine/threonine-protein kinase